MWSVFFLYRPKVSFAVQIEPAYKGRESKEPKKVESPVELMGKAYTLKVKCFMFGNI